MKHADPLTYTMKRVNNALRTAGLADLQIAVALGLSAPSSDYPRGRLHVHFLVIPGLHDLDVVLRALRTAGGRVPAPQAARQVFCRRICHGRAAADYALNGFDIRDHAEERRRLAKTFPGTQTFSLNRPMNAAVRADHDAQTSQDLSPRDREVELSHKEEGANACEKAENKPVQRDLQLQQRAGLVSGLLPGSAPRHTRPVPLWVRRAPSINPMKAIIGLGQPPPA